ncbi:MAG: hypothetical protein HQL74_14200 [Magnetococcales bacterium]|nr:hypothetical protein [Magnetococcales bacterium]
MQNQANTVQYPPIGVTPKSPWSKVTIDYGAVTWPGEIDLAPDALHDEIEQNGEWILS